MRRTLCKIGRLILQTGFLWVVLITQLAYGQFSSNVQGTVFDPSGLAVPSATVRLVNTLTGVTNETRTNTSGLYRFTSLPPAPYKVTVEATGFQHTEADVTLTTGQTAGLDFTLKVQASATEITVKEVVPILNTDETRLQVTLNKETLENMPVQNHGILALLTAAPGVGGFIGAGPDSFAIQSVTNATANGKWGNSNAITMDGIPLMSNIVLGAVNISPNPDSIQEMAVQTNSFSVTGSSSGSSVVGSMTTKSGTNQFHGVAHYTFTNQSMQAGTEFIHTYAPFKRHSISGALGGPVIKDKTFFFVSMESKRSTRTSTALSTFEDPAFVAWANGHFPNSIGTSLLNKFPIDNYMKSSVVRWGSSDYTAACTTPTATCNQPYLAQGPAGVSPPSLGLQYNVRGDQYLRGGKDRFYGNLYKTHIDQWDAPERSGFNLNHQWYNWWVSGNYTHTFNAQLINEASFGGYNYHGCDAINNSNIPSINIQNTAGFANVWGGLPACWYQHNYVYKDSVSWIHRNHSFRFGFQLTRDDDTVEFAGVSSRPTYGFNSLLDFVKDNVYSESGVTYSPRTGKQTPSLAGTNRVTLAGYVQDEWKVRSNLLVTLGVRWDDFANVKPWGFTDAFPTINNIIPATSGTLDQRFANGAVVAGKQLFTHDQANNWSPRVGVAWSPTKDRKLSIRGGIGVYRDQVTLGQATDQLRANPPTYITPTFGVTSTSGILPVYSIGTSSTYPYGFTYPVIPVVPVDAHGGFSGVQVNVTGIDANLTMPKTTNYMFAVERELPYHLVVGANYSGSHSWDQLTGTDMNRTAGDLIRNNGKLVRLNSSFSTMTYLTSSSVANYNAMILTARQTVGAGFSYQASYTWSHALDTGTCNTRNDYSSSYDCPPDQHNPLNYYYGSSSFDVRHRISLTAMYSAPSPNMPVLKQVLGGWRFSTLTIFQSGLPFTVVNSNNWASGGDYNADGYNTDYPYVPSGIAFSGFTRQQYINGVFSASSFIKPAAGTEGDEGRNLFRNAGIFNADLRVSKETHVPWFSQEGARLQLLFSFYNVLNKVNLSGVQANLGSATFARSTSTYQPRIIDIGARLEF